MKEIWNINNKNNNFKNHLHLNYRNLMQNVRECECECMIKEQHESVDSNNLKINKWKN
jgi:hypothetical protein